MEELAKKAAEAMAALGSCQDGTWQERRDALLRAGGECNSGFDEVFSWWNVDVFETE